MKHSHLWKFMLLTVTLWLAFAVASPAQSPIGTCGFTCNYTDINCGSAGKCTINIGNNGTVSLTSSAVNVSTVCVASGTTINWTVSSGTPPYPPAAYIVEFPSGASLNPFNIAGTPIFAGDQNSSAQGAQLSSTGAPGTCWEYTVAYCGNGNACVSADPQVVVACSPENPCPHQTKPQK